MKSINCKGNLVDLTTPKVMGILNLTPDSFYDGGKYKNEAQILNQVEKMHRDGATFIDVGAYSSRPGATDISVDEELARLIPVLKIIFEHFPDVLISVDTFRAKVAQEAIGCGGALVNDISAGGLDKDMMKTVARLRVPYIMMHMRGTPQTMKSMTDYEDLVKEVILYFSQKLSVARALGIYDLVIDPGFGFAKSRIQNFELLKNLDLFTALEVPLLAGLSRKSSIYQTLGITADQALNGTTALNMMALERGANMLRVHDVKEAVEAVKLFQAVSNS